MRICPICIMELIPTNRQGVEIDYCSQCRGIWLDRGELEKLIERSTMYQDDIYEERSRYRNHCQNNYRDDYYGGHHSEGHLGGGYREEHRSGHHNEGHLGSEYREVHRSGHHSRHRRKSFLGNLFDL